MFKGEAENRPPSLSSDFFPGFQRKKGKPSKFLKTCYKSLGLLQKDLIMQHKQPPRLHIKT